MWLIAVYIVAAVILLLLNAFFVATEFAIVKVRDTRMQELAREGNVSAALAHRILGKLDAYLSACQLGITIASLGLGWVGEPVTASLLAPLLRLVGITGEKTIHSISFAAGFTLITALHIIVGELAPKSLAIRKAEAVALVVARPLHWFYMAFRWPLTAMNAMSNAVLRIFGIRLTEVELSHSQEELRMIFAASHEGGQFTLSRLLMMENVLDFGTLQVKDVMMPWEKVVLLDAAKPWERNLELIRTRLHSRYPLAKSPRPDSQVHIKDLAIALAAGGGVPPDLLKIARPVRTVKAGMALEALLVRFHKTNAHLAFVEDDAGTLVGLVTLEDVLEELIGTIRDEFEQVTDYSLASVVKNDAIVLDMAGLDREHAVRVLAERLVKHHPACSIETTVAAIIRREALASTGLGDGIAIPHARAEGLLRPVAALGRSSTPIAWNAVDDKPVDLIFLILTPPHDEGAHIHILERIATMLSSDYLRDRLRQSQTIDEVVEVFKTSDKSLTA